MAGEGRSVDSRRFCALPYELSHLAREKWQETRPWKFFFCKMVRHQNGGWVGHSMLR